MREEVYETVSPSLGLATTIVRRFDPGLRTPAFVLPFSSTGPPVVPRDGEAIVMVAAEPEHGATIAPRGPDDVPEREVSHRRQPADR